MRLQASLRTALFAAALCAPLAFTNAPAIAQSPTMDDAWTEILREKGVSRNATLNRRVERVAARVLDAADQNPREWEFAVIQDDTPNAFALPNGKIGVHTGLFNVARTDDELAAIVAHEVVHVTQEHGRQRMTRSALVELGLGILGAAFDIDPNMARLAAGAATLSLVLPFSRNQETQADEVGLRYMARAGYDPRAAVQIWRKFEEQGEGPPEFLATHPSHGNRAATLEAMLPEIMPIYREHAPARERQQDPDEREWRLRIN